MLEKRRLLAIVALLYTGKAEFVIGTPNKDENYYDPCYFYLYLGRHSPYTLSEEEADWLIEENVVELTSGNNDPELWYRTRSYSMTPETQAKVSRLLKEIIAKTKKGSEKI